MSAIETLIAKSKLIFDFANVQESHKHIDDDGDLEAEIERELEQAEQERMAIVAARRRPKLLEVSVKLFVYRIKTHASYLQLNDMQ